LLSASLLANTIPNFILAVDNYYDMLNFSWVLYGIVAILAAFSFILRKDVPRNFGFIALAVFLLLDGYNVLRLAFDSDHPLYYFTFVGIAAMTASLFFSFHKETWKDFSFIMLSGYLFLLGAANFSIYNFDLKFSLLGASILFAIPTAILFFVRKAPA
jgi:hypothetical protein